MASSRRQREHALPVQIETLKTSSGFRPASHGSRANDCKSEGTFSLRACYGPNSQEISIKVVGRAPFAHNGASRRRVVSSQNGQASRLNRHLFDPMFEPTFDQEFGLSVRSTMSLSVTFDP